MTPALRTILFGGGQWKSGARLLRAAIQARLLSAGPHESSAMASPPTITASSTQPSGMTTEYGLLANPERFYFTQAGVLYANTTYRRFPSSTVTITGSGGDCGSGRNGNSWRVGVSHTGSKIAFRLFGSSVRFRFIVDDRYVDFTGSLTSTTSGEPRYLLLDFGSSATRMIYIEGQQGMSIMGVAVTPGDTVSAPTVAPVRLWIGGDSIVISGPTRACDGWGSVLASKLGVEDRTTSTVGGTGWVATASGVSYKFGDRLDADTAGLIFNAVVIHNGVNDIGQGAATIHQNAAADIQKLRMLYPSAPIFVMGPVDVNAPSAPVANYAATRDAISQACISANGVFFIDRTGVSYTKTDGTHPDSAGAVTLAESDRTAILAVLNTLS